MKTITKRDGRIVPFDATKITNAILRAMHETKLGENAFIANTIADKIGAIEKPMTVEEIQDMVEYELMASDRKDAARKYIIYRNERNVARRSNSGLMKRVREKIEASDVQNANANVDEASFGGRKNEASSVIQKEIALDNLMSRDVAEAHNNGLIYQHDLDSFAVGEHNCLNIDFRKVFKEGFTTRNGDVRPPNSFATACQLVAVIFQCQSQCQFGGVGAVHLDSDLAPFVRQSFRKHFLHYYTDVVGEDVENAEAHLKEMWPVEIGNTELSEEPAYRFACKQMEREGKQAAEALYHNLNTLESRAGSQVPFTSINIGRDTSHEGRMVTRWLLEASIAGIGKHHLTSIFPISIFCYKKGVNAEPGDPNYDLKQLAIKSMSKRIYPNWVNGDWSQAHEDASDPDTIFTTMGCRTMLGYDRHGLGYSRVGRGNNVPITIILPKLGIEYGIALGERSEADLDGFWNAFEDTLRLTERALLERFRYMARQSPKSATFMYENGTIRGFEEGDSNVYNALRHNTLAIGYIGIAEMCQALFGVNHVHSNTAHEFALKVVEKISSFAKEASERNDLNFSCYATPAESLCRTALTKLRDQYGVLKGITDREWITNSHHVPVWEKISIFDKLRIEAPFCKYPTGGCITYVECESTFMQNTKAVEDVIDYAMSIDIPYLAINFPIDSCLDCGYQGEFNDKCPECGSSNIQQLRRVTGYLTTDYRKFNVGKQAETENRVKHSAYTVLTQE